MPFTAVQEYENQTIVKNILLLNFSNDWSIIISFLLSLIYCTILIGNFCIFIVIRVETHLHTPMYFFLSNLSALDICYSSTTLPTMIFNSATGNKKISFVKCIAQLYLFVSLGGAECILLAVMAYDRFVAICNPLRYPVVMNVKLYVSLAAASWLSGFFNSILHTVMTSRLKFCHLEESVDHFYCDVPPLVQAACNPTKTSKILLYVISVFLGFTPFLYIVMTYAQIISTIMKIKSSAGRWKAFSTCSSHLMVVTVFYSTANLNYIGPTGYSAELETFASLLYSILTPVVNPIIYCLRNKEVKGALRKYFRRFYYMAY
ncbi:PREDICTED: olfactory receptor 5V1-like [Nanorana parkeri]|uniref:olfactory receptor 5V1-like n=1 Tax=Nanorana parkeri TaxID=125878 RepID=UPI0008542803|nr:PREDICTED: olfactory receptor 5V1-like [Nanorana parkeri]